MDDFVCGVNYWPRETGVHMWKEWNPESIETEFAQMAALSLNSCRVFLLWEDFQPNPDTISEDAMTKFETLVQIARRHGIRLIPTFFTGHMSGENWDVPWRRDRDPYSDPGMLRAQVRLVGEFARRYRDEQAILFWDLANEPDVFCKPRSVDAAWLWTYVLYREIKAHDPVHPVTLGTHAWSIFTPGPFRLGDVAEACDFLCMHPYPSYTPLCPEPLDSLRSSYFTSFACKLTEGLGGKRVLLEEFGSSTQMASEDVEGRFFSAALYSALANGVTGALAWCFGDFKRQDRLPYDSTPYEVGFGITAADGRVKPKGEALASFARVTRAARIAELSPAPARAAILVPKRYYDNPDEENGPLRNAAALFASFILAKRAGMDVAFVTPEQLGDAAHGYRALFVPCATRRGTLNVTDFAALKAFVEAGGTLYCSYDGLAVDGLGELFRVGVVSSSVPQGDTWSLSLPGSGPVLSGPLPKPVPPILARKHLAVSGCSEDANGSGRGIVVSEYGQGHAVLVTMPFELYLATTPYAFEDESQPYHAVYSLVGKLAGLPDGAHVCDRGPDVEVKEFVSAERRAIVAVNHGRQQQAVRIRVSAENARRRPAWSWRQERPISAAGGALELALGPSEGDIVELP